MIYEPQFLDFLQEQEGGNWDGEVFRHMFADYPPHRENTGGARWNPSGVAAIYTSLKRATALAESEYQISFFFRQTNRWTIPSTWSVKRSSTRGEPRKTVCRRIEANRVNGGNNGRTGTRHAIPP
jgi:hypothetical protein